MIERLQNFLSNINAPVSTTQTQAVSRAEYYSNPFANPFLSKETEDIYSSDKKYGKNNPFPGGYFAGYYNNKPNIVGRKLFVEV